MRTKRNFRKHLQYQLFGWTSLSIVLSIAAVSLATPKEAVSVHTKDVVVDDDSMPFEMRGAPRVPANAPWLSSLSSSATSAGESDAAYEAGNFVLAASKCSEAISLWESGGGYDTVGHVQLARILARQGKSNEAMSEANSIASSTTADNGFIADTDVLRLKLFINAVCNYVDLQVYVQALNSSDTKNLLLGELDQAFASLGDTSYMLQVSSSSMSWSQITALVVFDEAVALDVHGGTSASVSLYQKACSLNSACPAYFYRLGVTQYRLGMFSDALTNLALAKTKGASGAMLDDIESYTGTVTVY